MIRQKPEELREPLLQTIPLYQQEDLQQAVGSEFKRRSLREVWQDNNALLRERVASGEAYPAGQGTRTRPLSINSDRSHQRSISRRTVPAMGWIDKPISEEINRIAFREGLTRSKTIKTLLEWAVNEKLHRQTAALIPAVIEQSFDKVVGKRLARTESLLVRAALDINQTRTIATNTLGRQAGVTADKLNKILDRSLDKAKSDLTRRSPQMEEFIAAVVKERQQEQKEGETL